MIYCGSVIELYSKVVVGVKTSKTPGLVLSSDCSRERGGGLSNILKEISTLSNQQRNTLQYVPPSLIGKPSPKLPTSRGTVEREECRLFILN